MAALAAVISASVMLVLAASPAHILDQAVAATVVFIVITVIIAVIIVATGFEDSRLERSGRFAGKAKRCSKNKRKHKRRKFQIKFHL